MKKLYTLILALIFAVNAYAIPPIPPIPTASMSASLPVFTDSNKALTTKSVADTLTALGLTNAVVYKGAMDCSGNPNFPAADAGDTYIVSVDGKIGGASGVNVITGDLFICKTDGTVAGTQAAVGTNWNIIEQNIDLSNIIISGGTITGITDLTVSDGGTGASTLLDHGVLVGSGTDPVTALSVGATGEILVGVTGADPAFSATPSGLTSLGATTLNADHIGEKTTSHGVVFDNNVEVGSTTAGKNETIYATLGNEMAPALETANWTLGYDTGGWTATGGVMTKTASTGTQTSTPSGTFTVTAGRRYQVTIVCSAVSGTLTYSIGGVTGTTITATTITDNIIASTTGKIIFSGGAAVTGTITSLSVKEATPATGDLTLGGKLYAKNQLVLPLSKNSYPSIAASPSLLNSGLYFDQYGYLNVVHSGTVYLYSGSAVTAILSGYLSFSTTDDLRLYRDAANTLAIRVDTSQQIFRLYNTYTNSSNYERLTLTGVQGASVNITAESAGTGSPNLDVVITPKGTGAVKTGTYEVIDTHYDTIFIPASAMTPTATNGATGASAEYVTNDINMDYLLFDGATEQYAEFQTPMPENWDRGTIKAKVYWSSDTGSTTNDTVEWEIAGGALSDSDAIDAALGTAQVISDALLADNGTDLQISNATPAITIGGTPALGDLVHFKVSRNVGGTDDMTENARLFGVWIQYKANASVAAW